MRLELKLFETVIVPSYLIYLFIYLYLYINLIRQCLKIGAILDFLLRFLLQLVLLDIFTLDAESVKPLPL